MFLRFVWKLKFFWCVWVSMSLTCVGYLMCLRCEWFLMSLRFEWVLICETNPHQHHTSTSARQKSGSNMKVRENVRPKNWMSILCQSCIMRESSGDSQRIRFKREKNICNSERYRATGFPVNNSTSRSTQNKRYDRRKMQGGFTTMHGKNSLMLKQRKTTHSQNGSSKCT